MKTHHERKRCGKAGRRFNHSGCNEKMNKKYKTMIFDLDGTLLDTLDDLWHAVNHGMRENGLPSIERKTCADNLGHGIEYLIRRSVPEGTDEETTMQTLASFRDYYAAHDEEETRIFDGMTEVLQEMRRRGIGMAIVSNKFDQAVKELCAHYFEGLIELAVGESETVKKKPAPDAVLKSMHLLGAEKAETVYVGDSEVDAQTAQNAGLDCILCDWGMRSRDRLVGEKAIAIISRPSQLLDYVVPEEEKACN